jgi:hypothetical protein
MGVAIVFAPSVGFLPRYRTVAVELEDRGIRIACTKGTGVAGHNKPLITGWPNVIGEIVVCTTVNIRPLSMGRGNNEKNETNKRKYCTNHEACPHLLHVGTPLYAQICIRSFYLNTLRLTICQVEFPGKLGRPQLAFQILINKCKVACSKLNGKTTVQEELLSPHMPFVNYRSVVDRSQDRQPGNTGSSTMTSPRTNRDCLKIILGERKRIKGSLGSA